MEEHHERANVLTDRNDLIMKKDRRHGSADTAPLMLSFENCDKGATVLCL